MTVFVDTSALLAVFDGTDARHAPALLRWRELLETDEPMVTTSYVLVETLAVAQRRLGIDAVRTLARDVVPLLEVEWVESELHTAGTAAVLAAGRRNLSLVDCVSFEVMRRRGLVRAFAFDEHFAEQGFELEAS